MALTVDELRIGILARIEFGPETRRPIDERLSERLPALAPSERHTVLDAANRVVSVAEGLVREFRAGKRSEDSIEPALLESFPWLGADAVPVQSPGGLPTKDLSSQVRAFAYYLAMK